MKTSLFRRAQLSCLAFPFMFVASLLAELPSEVTAVLEKNLEATGGRERLAELKATRLMGTFSLPAMGMSGSTTMVHVYPDKLYTEQELPGMGKIVQACDGDKGWANDPMQGFRMLSEREVTALKQNESLRDMLDFDSTYGAGRVSGETELDGEMMTVLVLTHSATGKDETHYYGKESGLLMKKEMIADMGPMGEMPATMFIEEYQEQDGFVYPKSMKVLNAGMEVKMTFESLEIDPEVDPSLFEPPVSQ